MNIMQEKKKTRFFNRLKKRKWDEPNEVGDEKRPREEGFERIKKKKLALLFGYSGLNYYGMQRNPNVRTVEEELIKALRECDYITQEAFDHIQSICFQRAARTDKGVSAATQVVSLKMREDVEIPKINEKLPSDMRVFAIRRATKGFNSKEKCDARTYCYVLPTFAFENYSNIIENIDQFKISPQTIENVNKVLKHFVGTKNYHNFTSKKHFNDPSAKRYIFSFECEEPFIKNNVEFVTLKIKGQSFMLHQIRKMIGLTLAIVRGHTSESTITRSFTHERLDIPMAPGLGLYLDQVHYDRYNKRYGADGFHDPLTWDEFQADIESFKDTVIIPGILETDIKERSMQSWLETLSLHTYDIREGENADRQTLTGDENEEDDDDDDCIGGNKINSE